MTIGQDKMDAAFPPFDGDDGKEINLMELLPPELREAIMAAPPQSREEIRAGAEKEVESFRDLLNSLTESVVNSQAEDAVLMLGTMGAAMLSSLDKESIAILAGLAILKLAGRVD